MAEGAEPVKKTQEAKKTKKEEGSIGPSAVQWAVLRDAAIAAVMVGGGVKVAELVAMTVSCTLWEKALKIPARGNVREHMAMLLPIGEEALDAWMPQRESIGLAGDILFPAAMDRRRHDQRVKTASLNPSSVFRRVAALLSSCGITGERASGQTLRNTYAAMLIESGADNEALMECLGLFALSSAERLRLQHEAWLASGADA
jgi:site-specific recombinase XerD